MARFDDDPQEAVVSRGHCVEVPVTPGVTRNTIRRELDLDARRFLKLCDEQAGLIALTGTFTV